MMPLLAPLFPRRPIDVSRWLQRLPEDGSVPQMPGWRWIHTPGHTPVIFLSGESAIGPLSPAMRSLRQTKSLPTRWRCRPRKCMDRQSTSLRTGARRNLQFNNWPHLNQM